MDGMFGHHILADTPSSRAARIGILYAEDFDELPSVSLAAEPEIAPAPAEPAITAEQLERACKLAVEHARRQWEQDAAQQRQAMLRAIADAVAGAREEAAREALALAEGTAVTMLTMLAGALPTLCREHGPAEARAFVAHLLPSLQSEPRITIRVHASVAAALEQELRHSEIEGAVSVIGSAAEPGDLRVTWENGSFERNTRAILSAIGEVLGRLGLLDPSDTGTLQGRLELAQ
jgi:hypothetical protein